MGAPRPRQLLGIPGSLAFADCVNLRHGNLSHALRCVSDPHVPVVSASKPGMVGGSGGGGRLRAPEYCRSESRLPDVALAVLRVIGAIHCHCVARSVQTWSSREFGDKADYINR